MACICTLEVAIFLSNSAVAAGADPHSPSFSHDFKNCLPFAKVSPLQKEAKRTEVAM